MYGLVNKAVADLVRSKFGEEVWERICLRAGIDNDVFVSMEAYPDEVTYKLVGAASEELKTPADQLLQAFGEYWVTYTAKEGYGPMLKAAGSNLKEFLLNLNNLHARVAVMAPKLRPPSFRCTDVTDQSLTLHYHSTRQGLGPMVIGLLKGLGTMFNTKVAVSQSRAAGVGGADHDEFLLEFSPA